MEQEEKKNNYMIKEGLAYVRLFLGMRVCDIMSVSELEQA